MIALLQWWLRRLALDARQEHREWAVAPERPLLIVGRVFFLSWLLHWLGYRLAIHRVGWSEPFFAPTQWDGRTGWRKPLVFGISNAMVFCSLRQALRWQLSLPRAKMAHLAAWSTAIEVGIITLQAWRGVPSHFNTETHLDATLYGIKLLGVAVLGSVCVATAVAVVRGLGAAPSASAVALRHGMVLLCVSIAAGVAQVFYGHHPREPRVDEMSPCLRESAGASASPCYEIRGEAVVKLMHFLPLHATEVLLLLAWACSLSPAGAPAAASQEGVGLVRASAFGCWAISILGIWLTVAGKNIKNPSPEVLMLTVTCLAFIVGPFFIAFFTPLRLGIPSSSLGKLIPDKCALEKRLQ